VAEVAVSEAAVGENLHGQVKWFNNQKGYGFIVREEYPDIFVHHSAILMEGYRTLQQGEDVTFNLRKGDKGLQAFDVAPAHE
jgi:cold shock protein